VQDTRRASSMVRGAGCREINLRIRRREKNVLDILFYRSGDYTHDGTWTKRARPHCPLKMRICLGDLAQGRPPAKENPKPSLEVNLPGVLATATATAPNSELQVCLLLNTAHASTASCSAALFTHTLGSLWKVNRSPTIGVVRARQVSQQTHLSDHKVCVTAGATWCSFHGFHWTTRQPR
jgi:hypothetical protein